MSYLREIQVYTNNRPDTSLLEKLAVHGAVYIYPPHETPLCLFDGTSGNVGVNEIDRMKNTAILTYAKRSFVYETRFSVPGGHSLEWDSNHPVVAAANAFALESRGLVWYQGINKSRDFSQEVPSQKERSGCFIGTLVVVLSYLFDSKPKD